MSHLLKGKNRTMAEVEGFLYVNSREQPADFRLDSSALLGSIVTDLNAIKPEFVVLDVFNVMHPMPDASVFNWTVKKME